MTLMCGAQFMQHSICPGLINRLSGEEQGIVNGLCLACYYTGGALGSYMSVAIFTAASWSACIALVALVVAAMAGVAFSLRNILPEKNG